MKKITASKLLGLAFNQLELQYGRWISSDKEVLHRTIYDIQNELGEVLIPLQNLHFAVMGAYPYSSDLYTAMWILTESGWFSSYSEGGITTKVHIKHCHDTGVVTNKILGEVFKGDEVGLRAFHQMVAMLAKGMLVEPPL